MQPIDPSDLFVTVAQMRDGIDTLLKRGKPATAAELHQLLEQVKAQGEQLLSQAQQGYHITLNGEAAAKLIVPYMPTNTETGRTHYERGYGHYAGHVGPGGKGNRRPGGSSCKRFRPAFPVKCLLQGR